MLANPPIKVYWDACAWIGLINSEPNKIHPLRAIWEDAQKGKYELWTSSYVYIEVFKVKAEDGDPPPPEKSDEIVENVLAQPYVKLVQLNVPIAKLARDLRRSLDAHGLKRRPDAIHLATAVYWNLDELHTWDNQHLIPLNGHVSRRDGRLLVIRMPGPEVMGPLFADSFGHPQLIDTRPSEGRHTQGEAEVERPGKTDCGGDDEPEKGGEPSAAPRDV